MMLRTLLWLTAILLFFHVGVGPVAAQAKVEARQSEYRLLCELLETKVNTKPLQDKVKLRQALEHLSDVTKGKLTFIVDQDAILARLGADMGDLYDQEVVLPPAPGVMKVSQMLQLLLPQAGKGEVTYILRNGVVEITDVSRALPEALLTYPITTRFNKTPLEDAIEELCELSGATIVIDMRLADKAKTPVSATFRGNVTLEGAVRLLAEMADLKTDLRENVLFITTTRKAKGDGQQKTELQLKNRRLDLAVQDLADWSGETILLDPAFMPTPAPLDLPFLRPRSAPLDKAGETILLDPAFKPTSAAPLLPFKTTPHNGAIHKSGGRIPGQGAGGMIPGQGVATGLPTDNKVTATFAPNVSAKVAAQIIARQVGLSAEIMENVIYITRK
jgi:hypothetical protein